MDCITDYIKGKEITSIKGVLPQNSQVQKAADNPLPREQAKERKIPPYPRTLAPRTQDTEDQLQPTTSLHRQNHPTQDHTEHHQPP